MTTTYQPSLQERIRSLTEEHEQLKKQYEAVLGSLPSNPSLEQKRKRVKDCVILYESQRKVESRLRQAKRLLARSQGDEYEKK